MTIHTRRFGRRTAASLGGLAVTVVAASTGLTGTAAAATAPGFLAAKHLPPHPSSSWTADRVTAGLPDPVPFCFDGELPDGDSTWHRQFRTDLDTNAVQTTVVTPNAAAARDLAAELNEAMTRCAAEVEQNPELTADWKDYGSLSVEEGADVYGVRVASDWGATDIHLFSVGRDGNTVTVVRWGQLGDFSDAPVAAFRKTTTIAVNRLY
jgi:hypothetical protein